jgi:enoyl-CoA hydratase
LGLFPEVVEPEQLIETARAAAKKIIDASEPSVRISKLALRHGVEMEFSANLEVEAYMQSYAFRTAEHKQRIAAYRDRVKKKGA